MTSGYFAVTYGTVKAPEVLRARIRQRLEQLHLKPADLNRLLGRSKNWASGYFDERYDMPIDQLDRLAGGLTVSVASLFDASLLQETKPPAQPSDTDTGADQGSSEQTESDMTEDLRDPHIGKLVAVFRTLSRKDQRAVWEFVLEKEMARTRTTGRSGERKKRAG
jgi:hypothetical protein